MAFDAKKYLDLVGLRKYDAKIKALMAQEDAKSFKTVLLDGDVIKFYKKENAIKGDREDASITIASSDITALKTRVGMSGTLNAVGEATDITAILNLLNGGAEVEGSIAEQIATAKAAVMGTAGDVAGTKTIEGLVKSVGALAAEDINLDARLDALEGETGAVANALRDARAYTDAEIQKLDVEDSAASGQFVTAVSEANGKISVSRAALQASDIPELTLEKISDAGTAAAEDVATVAIAAESTDEGLVRAKQVAAFVKEQVADLAGAMHFRGVVASTSEVEDPKAGDVVIIGVKEYVYSVGSEGAGEWHELGDETIFVTKSTTIAGVDLQNNVTKEELLNALNVADGAQVNVLEGVKVNGVDLAIEGKKVNVTVAEGSANGKISVNGNDVAVHGLASAAYAETTAFDAAGAAQDAFDAITAIEETSINALFVGTSVAE